MYLYINYCDDKDVAKLVREAFQFRSDIYMTFDCLSLYTDETSPTYGKDFIIWSNGGGEIFDSQVLDHVKRIVQKMKGNEYFKEYRRTVFNSIKEVEDVTAEEMHEMGRKWRNGEEVVLSFRDIYEI